MLNPVEKLLRRNLLSVARAFAKATDRKLTTVARLAHGDSRFFDDLAAGRGSFTARKYDEVARYFTKNWPAEKAWPPLSIIMQPRQGEPKNGTQAQRRHRRRKTPEGHEGQGVRSAAGAD